MPMQTTLSSNKLDAELLAKESLLQKSEISLWLYTYDDIFSDFDPRPFNERSLSIDFLDEAQRAARDKGQETIQLKLLIPTQKRNTSQETLIKKRLKDYFKKRAEEKAKEIKKLVTSGILFTLLGILLMVFATAIAFYEEHAFFATFLLILFEPAGWFFFWEGMGLIVFEAKKLKPSNEFYQKMKHCDIRFWGY